jgi:hypothetical protein
MLPETVCPFTGERVVTARLFPALAGIATTSSARRSANRMATRSLRGRVKEVAADLTPVRIDLACGGRIPRLSPFGISLEG